VRVRTQLQGEKKRDVEAVVAIAGAIHLAIGRI